MSVTRADRIAAAARELAAAGVPDAARDARLLARWAACMDGGAFSARLAEAPGEEEAVRFRRAVAARAERRPLSHITGEREFWGRRFRVTPDVLDPRPETETLIAAALEGPEAASVLDLGVGSGCILLTLLAEWPSARGVGVDVSAAAVEVARENAAALRLSDRARILRGDWFGPAKGKFDLVVSNPPYVTAAEWEDLAPEARREPRDALTPGGDGLDAYRAIAEGLSERLAPGGRALLEFGAGQEAAVARIFENAGMRLAGYNRDLDGRPRCAQIVAR